jgi:anti-anti-sigma factor
MSIQQWSDTIVLVELEDDPGFTDDMTPLMELLDGNDQLDVVLNFTGVNYLNSSNIAKLLRLRKLLISRDRKLILCGVSTHVWGLFLVTGLDKVFNFCDDVSMGLASAQINRG